MTFNPNEVYGYTPEKLSAMSYKDVSSLYKQSKEKGFTRLCEWCEVEITRREPPPFERHAPCVFQADMNPSRFQKEVCESLKSFAFDLEKKFDFSIETAESFSKSKFSRFKVHQFLGANKDPKYGGGMKSGNYAVDRYISWRLYDDIYSLTILLAKDSPISETHYHVYAPQEALEGNYQPISELRLDLNEDDELGLVKGGIDYKTLNEAMDAYEQVMYKVAPRK